MAVKSVVLYFYPLVLLYFGFLALQVAANTDAPVAVVVSGSMEPALARGDLVLVHGRSVPRVGDIVLFRFGAMNHTVIHRVIRARGTQYMTQGDANSVDDRFIYDGAVSGRRFLDQKEIVGTVAASIPYIGYPILLAKEHWIWTVVMVGALELWPHAKKARQLF